MFPQSKTLIYNDNKTSCRHFDPDKVFTRFKVVEFPISIVGLKTTQYLDVEKDLNKCAYLKTMCDGTLMKFEEARQISASHRAFIIKQIDSHTLRITFHPLNECVGKARRKNEADNRFVFDLRLIQVDGIKCCNNEFHSEIGRYYICGKYEVCKFTHYPHVVEFGEVIIHSKTTKYVRIYNNSIYIAAKFEYKKVTSFSVFPPSFTIPPNSSLRVKILLCPSSLKVGDTITFLVRNPDLWEDCSLGKDSEENDNYIVYPIKSSSKVLYNKKPEPKIVESLHKINEKSERYTFVTKEEKNMIQERKKIAEKQMQIMKVTCKKKPIIKTLTTRKDGGCDYTPMIISKPRMDYCDVAIPQITTYSVFDILFLPLTVNFGRICVNTYGEEQLIIKNNTIYDISIQFQIDECVLYTNEKCRYKSIKLKSMKETTMAMFCLGYVEGNHSGTFEYTIDGKFNRKHPYLLQVGHPGLLIKDKNLKFGMTTADSFIMSVPVRIYNLFNVAITYQWDTQIAETPFEVFPETGSIAEHSCTICDVIYTCKPTKTKNHEIDLISLCTVSKVVPLELIIFTRKLSIKFLQPAIVFKDIALNIVTIERVKLENSSKEMVTFNVLDTLIPGLRIEPMSGTIGPKTIITLTMIVKISCVLEFSVDVIVKINNKENVEINVSGNVVEPKITISPKYIYLSRVPSYMIAFIPVTINNLGYLKSEIEVIDTGDENIFDVYIAQGNEKIRIFKFMIDAGQSKTVFIRVYDIFRREYDMYIPFRINGLIGPPDLNSHSIELSNYLREYEGYYENNTKVKIKSMNKDICYCRITGVFTVPWIEFSVEKFEIDYVPTGSNKIDFTMTNVSKYDLQVTILTTKLCPVFSLDLTTEDNQSIINESNIKFELNKGKKASLTIKFHPKGNGRFVATAPLYLDKHMTIAYHNLTFIGKRQTPPMTPSIYRVIFPPTYVGTELNRVITIHLKAESELDNFSCMSKEEPNLSITFVQAELVKDVETSTVLTVSVTAFSRIPYYRNIIISFHHSCGSFCDIEVAFCFTHCILTLHTDRFTQPENNPYPYYPEPAQTELYEYMQTCVRFLEKWMFQQGFRRDLYPVIPDTFYAISSSLSSQSTASTGKGKGLNVSYLNFMRRIAGPLMKHVSKINEHGVDENFRCIKEIHDTYKKILKLIKARGANLLLLQPKFLLSYEQFVIYSENVAPKGNADIILTQELLGDVNLFNRLSKQSWVDFILQSYKVFVVDSCFFDCVCVSSQNRNVVTILIKWYNDNIMLQHNTLRGPNKPKKVINNITTDLSDGIAIISTILTYCPFLASNFTTFCEITNESSKTGVIIHNACLIIEAMNQLRLFFPLSSKDFLESNFIQMLFLSIHIYVILPMFKVKDTIKFNPPLLRSSTRLLSVFPTTQESLIFNFVFLNYANNNFVVEKAQPPEESGKKMFLSVKYFANFVKDDDCILLVHGYNKTRIFDTYVIFKLHGKVGFLNPIKKWKLTAPLYRSIKVDGTVASPFATSAIFTLSITDEEPTLPVEFESNNEPYRFYFRRLTLLDKEMTLIAYPKETSGQDVMENKVYLQMTCLSTQVGNSWIWFRSELGEFFIKITTQPRWDLALETFQVPVQSWPMDPCSCGEACECYRTAVLNIPHRNELMVKALRTCLSEFVSNIMLQVFDSLIESTTGKLILGMLLEEGGTNMSDVNHILRSELDYRISSKMLTPRLDRVTLAHHTSAVLTLPITLPARGISEKYSVTFTSDCGMDIRTYKIIFYEPSAE